MVSIYSYIDYRLFIKDYFSALKRKNPNFSFRSFNRQAGISSSGFLKLVMDSKRNLGEEGIQKVAKGFKLSEEENRYFSNLVRFNQSQTHAEKDHYFRELLQSKPFNEATSVTAAQYQLFSHWYYVAVLEIVRLPQKTKSKSDRWVQSKIHPKIGLREIQQALKALQELGLISQNASGEWTRSESSHMLSTSDEVQSLNVVNFHQQMSKLASRAVSEDDSKSREFSALTIAVSEDGFQKIKEEIQAFRKRLHALIEREDLEKKTTVAQINLQLFQLTESKRKIL